MFSFVMIFAPLFKESALELSNRKSVSGKSRTVATR